MKVLTALTAKHLAGRRCAALVVCLLFFLTLYRIRHSLTNNNHVPVTIAGKDLSKSSDSESSETESALDLGLSTRRLVLLAVRRMNQLVRLLNRKRRSPLPCSKWWANPLDVYRNEVVGTTTEYEDRILEFEAHSTDIEAMELMERPAVFRAMARVYDNPDVGVVFLDANFTQIHTKIFDPPEEYCGRVRRKNKSDRLLNELCLCDHDDQAAKTELKVKTISESIPAVLQSWPVNASFMVQDYFNFNDLNSWFHILPDGFPPCALVPMYILISTAPTHFEHRQAIRQTYGRESNLGPMKLDFVVGRVKNETIQAELVKESKIYGDLIQANFIDSYHNLTLKQLAMHAYVYLACSESNPRPKTSQGFDRTNYHPPKHILKADDDNFLNVDIALRVAEANPGVEMIGNLRCGVRPNPKNDPMDKYYTPSYMYPGDLFPAYLFGGAYLLHGEVVPRLLRASLTVPFIHMDDVYFTGILARHLGFRPGNSAYFFTGYDVFSEGGPGSGSVYCDLKRMANSWTSTPKDMHRAWSVWNSGRDDQCEKRDLNDNLEQVSPSSWSSASWWPPPSLLVDKIPCDTPYFRKL